MRSRTRHGVNAVMLVHGAVGAVVLSSAAGFWGAAMPAVAMAHVRDMLVAAAFYVVTWAVARRPGRGTAVQIAVCLAGGVAAAWLLLQYRHLAPDDKVGAASAVGRMLSAPFPPVTAWTPLPNSLATLLEGLVLAAAGLGLSTQPRRVRLLAGGAAALMALAVFVTASRGAWVAVVVAATAALLAWRQVPAVFWRAGAALGAAVALAAAVAALAPGEAWFLRWATAAGRPDRVDVYRHALTLLGDAPFSGVGGGAQFAPVLSAFALLIQVPYLTYAHALPLDLWLQHGLAGLAAWIALGVAVMMTAAAGERRGLGWRTRGLWAGLLAVFVHGMTDARQMVDAWTWWPTFALAGLLAGAMDGHGIRLPARSWAWPPTVAVALAAAVLAGRGHPAAAWEVNRGAIAQHQALAQAGEVRDTLEAAAERHYLAGLAHDPADLPGLRRRGLQLLARDDFAGALAHLRAAWRLDDAHPTAQKALGLAATWTGDIALARAVLADVPGIVDELNTWSRFRAEQGQIALALNAGRVSLALVPDQPDQAAWLAALDPASAPRR